MEKTIVITKKYNHMNFDTPYGFNTLFGINCFNSLFGLVTLEQFTMISGFVGLLMNLIFFIVKMYMLITGRKLPENTTDFEPPAVNVDIDVAPFERRCIGCATKFEPEHADQIFCTEPCKETYMNNLTSRKPFVKPQPGNEQ